MLHSTIEISQQDQKYMNLAHKMAEDATPHAGARVVSIIAFKKDVLSFGFNGPKSHPFQAKYRKNPHAVFWHAETNAIMNAIKRGHEELLKRSSMYVLRLTNAGTLGLSMPCSGCTKAILEYDVKRVLFSNGNSTDLSGIGIGHFSLNGCNCS